jgi:hypothetical protein
MNMDKNMTTTIIPASTWPVKRLAFKIRKRGFVAYNDTSLLISNSLGVWSLRRRRYVKKRRFHRFSLLKAEALPVERRYTALRKVGMHSWPEYDEQVAFWRSRLVDIYWDAAPAWYREDVVDYYRAARRRRMQDCWVMRFIFAPISVVTLADTSFQLVKKAFLGERVDLLLFTVFYILQVILWCIMLFKPDASALKMLEILHKGYVNEIIE